MEYKSLGKKIDFIDLAEKIADERYPFLLDSCKGYENKLGKFSFAGFNPIGVFKAKDSQIEIMKNEKWENYSCEDTISAFNEFMKSYRVKYEGKFPFNGGGVGFFSYDLCHKIEKLPRKAKDDVKIPDIFFAVYDGIFIYDHNNNETTISARGINEGKGDIIEKLEKFALSKSERFTIRNENGLFLEEGDFSSNFIKIDYLDSISKIKSYIKRGEVYQVNLTQRFSTKTNEKPWSLYKRQREINPAPFSAFLDYGEFQILSTSPERFVRTDGMKYDTRPIKGTISRGKSREEDEKNKKILSASEKDKSELLMIVDLERNDLGKISVPGSVKVDEIFALEEYPAVFHLVSNISAQVREDVQLDDLIKSVFPGGSITGTPKIRAMEIIDELEPTQRNIYTGSLGYIDFNGNMDLSIVIRTILVKAGRAFFQAGGAIVWDSEEESEYEETLVKSRALKRALKGRME